MGDACACAQEEAAPSGLRRSEPVYGDHWPARWATPGASAPSAIAWACSCSPYVGEARGYTVASITQLEGSGDEATEVERWKGELTLTAGVVGDQVDLYLFKVISDEQVRHVRINASRPSSNGDTGGSDTGAEGAR